MTASQENPLSTITVPVPFRDVRAEHVEPAIDALIATSQARIDAIAVAPRTYETTLGALDRASTELDFAMSVAGHLEAIDGTPAMRAAYNRVLPKVSAFG